jgi:hypothetical protein
VGVVRSVRSWITFVDVEKIMKKFILAMLLSGVSLFSQSGIITGSIYKTLFTNAVAPTIVTVLNAGQVGNQVFLQFANAPAKTCTSSNTKAQLEFSYDTTNWVAFGTPTTTTNTNTLSQLYYGAGAYPFVRFNLVQYDNVNCVVSGYYTGSTITSSLLNSYQIIGTTVGPTDIPISPFNLIGTIMNDKVVPIYQCSAGNLNSVVSAGTTKLQINSGVRNEGICYISANSIGVATIQLIEGTGATCGTGTRTIFPVINLVAGVPFNLGSGIGIVAGTTTLGDVCAVVTGANVSLAFGGTVIN